MVCLIKKLPVNLNKMRTVLIDEIDNIINHELYYLDITFPGLKTDIKNDENKYNNKINRIKNNIIEEIRKKMNTDYFLYRIIDDGHCTFKHNRGKNDGNFCCKKIKTNLIDDKKDYLCCTHSKKHIPKKKDINKNNHNSNDISINNSIKLIDINNNLKNVKKDITSEDKSLILNENKTEKPVIINRKNKIIKRTDIYCFKKVIKEYNYNNNIICRYSDCNNNCIYKHINKEILLSDLLKYNKNSINRYKPFIPKISILSF